MKPWWKNNRSDTNPIWLTVFSDMSTNLMLFFLIMFAMTRMSAFEKQQAAEGMKDMVKGKSEKQEKKMLEQKVIHNLKETVRYGKLYGYANIEETDVAVKLTLNVPVLFPSGSAELNKDVLAELERLIGPLKDFPNEIVIEGHTDNVPISGGAYGSNWELSIARAVSVIDFLIEKGLDPGKLVAGGYGEFHPAFPNDSNENRAKNRRIEMTLVRQPRTG